MNLANIKSPGVYIQELSAFPNSVVAVASAVPAFIGYTPQANYQGKSLYNQAVKVSSLAEFKTYFCLPDAPAPASPTKQYNPEYYLVQQKTQPTTGDYLVINGNYYSIVPDPNTIYYMYNAVQLFYENGGGDAYIVAVGTYGAPSKNPMNPSDQIVNANVQLADLLKGLSILQNEPEPTMYICPEATLLSVANNGTLMAAMLSQSSDMGTSVSILDVIGGNNPDQFQFMTDIETFRNNTGNTGLDYGAAYYPFIGTTIMQGSDIDYTNLFGGDISQLTPIINPPTNPNPAVTAILANIANPNSGYTVAQNNNALINACPTYAQIVTHVLNDANIQPPSGAMAGVIASTDKAIGPWQAPANASIIGASFLPIYLSENQQGPINVDAVSGKSINAIRFFNGNGILVWGARTLDGNSQDWRYLQVRRTLIFLEQSCKLAAQAYVFAPNSRNTWEAVKSMIGSFLNSIWAEGGLQGATPDAAYSVDCGLGTTMTGDDILNGFMRVSVKVAVTHPAEFIVLTFQQQMVTSS